MGSISNFVLASLLIGFVTVISGKSYIIGGYYTNWSQYRATPYAFYPENIDPTLYTHLFYAFSSMGTDFRVMTTDPNDNDMANGTLGMYSRVNALKSQNPNLKTLVSFGGSVFQQANVALMASMLNDGRNRETFILSVIDFVRRRGYDGFDFNWYPDVNSKASFALLITELRQAFTAEGIISGRPPLLLTVAIPPLVPRITAGYDALTLSKNVDFFNVMAFDYHGSWENQTGFNTPMVGMNGDHISITDTFTYLFSVFNSSQLVMGFAFYGRGWTLAPGANVQSIPQPAIGPSPAQPWTQTPGLAANFEICLFTDSQNYVDQFDIVHQVPYAYKFPVWVNCDNARSTTIKLNWLIQNNLGGAFGWSLDLTDFLGTCKASNGVKFPVSHLFNSMLGPISG